MRFVLTLLIVCIGFCSNSQTKLDYGDIIFDSSFVCNDRGSYDYGDSGICRSNNEFEVRLESISLPHGGKELIVVGYNKGKWYANKYRYLSASIGNKRETVDITPVPEDYDRRIFNYVFNLTFDTLKNNRIFLLPDQDKLKLDGKIFDGVRYTLTYKVNNRYRQYSFHNIESFLEDNPKSTELKNYIKITRSLYLLFN
jgi:hypothetical protein